MKNKKIIFKKKQDVSSTIKSAIRYPPKLALGKISPVTFCK